MFLIDKKLNPGVTADKFGTLPHFTSWLERQPADEIYCYTATGECLVAQYFKAHEPSFRYCGPGHWSDDKNVSHNLPWGLDSIARGYYMPDGREYANSDRTFGAALTRALALRGDR